ncbi:MAG: hypothetical protein FWD22_02190 [Treponema sp.]|nr:hypothetical protein [Treponema sp.]
MAVSNEWQDTKYNEIFEQEIRGLTRRMQSDTSCKVEDLEGILKNLYIRHGSDQDHGGIQEVIMAATIAAYEHFIDKMKSKTL